MSEVLKHIETISRKASLEVMGQVLDIIYNREEVSDETFLQLDDNALYDLYFDYIARAIDRLEDDLLKGEGK